MTRPGWRDSALSTQDSALSKRWEVGIVGTFDVENYGDLLFPLIAEAELRQRLGDVRLHRFSYAAKAPPDWPYEVTSVADLPRVIADLDALLIGGGFLIRFDKHVADGYGPPVPDIHHPTGYWLTPALMALEHGVPVIWNAPGMHLNGIPEWAEPLMKLALGPSAYISVRDRPSKAALSRFVDPGRITIMHDTGFGISRLLPAGESSAMTRMREIVGLTKPYLIVQPVRWKDDRFPAFLEHHAERFADYQLLALPIGPILGDHVELLGDALPRFVRLPYWPDPLLLAELISHASAVIGYSYHLAITALTAGVPVFTSVDLSAGKFTALRDIETVYPLSSINDSDPDVFFSRLGKTAPAPSVLATLAPLAEHWDRVAATIEQGRGATPASFRQFWQTLPALLEKAEPAEENRVIDLQRIISSTLQTDPYEWAAIGGLFSPHDAAALAATFPRDHYKLVEAHGGEKDYAYDARALIGMGDDTVAYRDDLSEPWQRLADDLRSPAYRNAIAALTGCDLSDALLEVNVFHYGPGASLGAHPDLPDKIVTHVLYFNESWNNRNGGCLTILRSNDPASQVAEISPVVGNSAILVRSDGSWHAVSPVVQTCRLSRRSLTATFYRPTSTSSMWPEGDQTPLHDYHGDLPWWRRLGKRRAW
jgi:Rps23 Pro-64 3,4-dihydroxylase Tpa1-like proline 4-hydroxylase